jgi:hypothetical protein
VTAIANAWISDWSNDVNLKEDFYKTNRTLNETFVPQYSRYERVWIYSAISFTPSEYN